jgi:hypothetical protein
MSLKRWQLGLLHSVPKQLGIEEDHRRLILRNLASPEAVDAMNAAGKFWSSKFLTEQDFIRIMAYYERCGWTDPRNGPDYWQAQAKGADGYAMRCKTIKMADVLGWTHADGPQAGKVDFGRLNAFVVRMTQGRCNALAQCDSQDLFVIIEALKKMAEREEPRKETA